MDSVLCRITPCQPACRPMHSFFLHRHRQTPACVDLFLGSLIMASLVAGGCNPPTSSHPAVGRLIGNLPLVSLADPTEGENPSATASPTFLKKVTLLNFWGVWCMPCRRELPGLVRLADRLQSEPAFQFVAVSCGSGALTTSTRSRPRRVISLLHKKSHSLRGPIPLDLCEFFLASHLALKPIQRPISSAPTPECALSGSATVPAMKPRWHKPF